MDNSTICLKCAQCGAITQYKDAFLHGKMTLNHKLDCSASEDSYPKCYLTSVPKP